MKSSCVVRPAVRLSIALAATLLALPQQSAAWGRDGHRMIGRLAAEKLPADVPEFLRSASAQAAMDYYAPEPDNWKSSTELELKVAGEPEHFLDMEWADLVGPELPRKRYDFIRALEYAQKSHPDLPLTPEKVGMLPYAVDEGYERLKAAMRDYREMAKNGEDTKPVEAEIVFLAGILGHWAGDASQPLHATIQYNGWTGANPNNYTTSRHIHAQFESDFVHDNVPAERDVAPLIPAQPVVIGDVFTQFMAFLRQSNAKVETLYQLEKNGGFEGQGTKASRTFVDERLAAGATELRNLIYTAWVRSADPVPVYHEYARKPETK